MKRYILFIVAIFCLVGTSQPLSAQVTEATQYLYNPFAINPAAAGLNSDHRIFANFRQQWSSLTNAPSTVMFSYNGRFGKQGLGVSFINDKAGALENNRFLVAYSYPLQINETSRLSLGISGQLTNFQVRPDASQLQDLNLSDPVLADAIDGSNILDASFGAFYQNDNGLYAGISAPSLLQTKIGGTADIDSDFNDLAAFYYGIVGYKISRKNIVFDPSVLFRKMEGAPLQIELNAKAWFMDEILMAGVSYRTQEESLAFILGINIENTVQIYYAHDANMGELNQYFAGSNEFTLGFRFGGKKQE